jgi:phosphoglycerol transferase MdoB-like AlkP superfamily enzyme
MTTYFKQIGNLLYRILVLIVLYSLSRLFFFCINYQTFSGNDAFGILKVFFYGIRFDYSSIIQYNLLFILLYLLPFNVVYSRWYYRIVDFFFYVVNFFLLLTNFVDAEYFKYTGKRSTADLFNYIFLSNDVAVLLPQFLKDFWYIGLVWVVSVLAGILLLKRLPFRSQQHAFNSRSWIFAGVLTILVWGILFLGARGTGLKPIRIITAARYSDSQNIPLLLNTPFSILHTIQAEIIKPIQYFDDTTMNKIYTPEQVIEGNKPKRKVNVMIIILESFSKEFIGYLNGGKGYTPCFDSIMSKGLVFENAMANGKRSIEAVPALLAGLPSFTDESYISSRYSGNKLLALPSLLKAEGYHTSFFHGGRNGTMSFDEFSHVSGIENYYGLNEYTGPEAFDGNWGIYDEEFLQFYAGKLNSFPQPFFTAVFTLSSHNPYTIPEKHKNDFKDTPNELVRSIRYADFALGKFFQTISKSSWFKNTVFVFSADHTATEQSKRYANRAGMFRIPIVYYFPGDTAIHGRSLRVTQQSDVMPSLLDYMGIHNPFVAFGTSVFSKEKGFAVNYLGGIYQYYAGDYMLSFDGEKSTALYNITRDQTLKKNILKDSVLIVTSMEPKLKAVIQQYNSRILRNRMVTIRNENVTR